MPTCLQCRASFGHTAQDLAFYEELGLPEPVLCPDCRSLLRCSHRNERSLSRRACSLCKKDIVCMYAANAPFPVYCHDCFFNDRWNPLEFGQPYRDDVPFFEQLQKLLAITPRLSIINKQTENSEYSNYSYANKNCYLTFGSHYEEDCLYGAYSTKSRDCVDCLWIYGGELLYECLFSKKCYHSLFLDHCADCSDCAFSVDMKGCSHCLFCSNLHQRSHCIFNEQLTKEEYDRQLRSRRLDTWSGLQEARRIFLEEMPRRFPVRAVNQVQCENCEGSMLVQCKNLRRCFFATECEDCTYSVQCDNTFHAMDMDYMGYDRSERVYQTIGCQGLFDCVCCNACWHGSGLRSCQFCFSCHDCTGCISLQQKKHCILNREYSEDEYRRISGRIVEDMKREGTWGQFFPASLSPFAYNETMAKDWFPFTETEAKALGYQWKTGDEVPDVKKVINAVDLPERVEDIPDDVLNWAIFSIGDDPSAGSGQAPRPYRIVKKELEFYRSMNLPLPRHHPEERHRLRIQRRHQRKLWNRECANCQKAIATSYAPKRPEKVLCESCYLKEVY